MVNVGPLGAGLNGQIWALCVGASGDLYAGGVFSASGVTGVNHVARWNGTSWVPLGSGTANGVGGIVYAITPLANGDMVVGGSFTAAGGVANRGASRAGATMASGTGWAAAWTMRS
jgi:hypothetical protein